MASSASDRAHGHVDGTMGMSPYRVSFDPSHGFLGHGSRSNVRKCQLKFAGRRAERKVAKMWSRCGCAEDVLPHPYRK